MKKIESGSLAVMLDEETLGLRIEKDGVVWNTDPKKTPEQNAVLYNRFLPFQAE